MQVTEPCYRHEADARRRAASAVLGGAAQGVVRCRTRHQDPGQLRRGGGHRAEERSRSPHTVYVTLRRRLHLEVHFF